MFATVISTLTASSLSILGSLVSKPLFDAILRKTLIAILKKVVASTENTVDDDLVAPIIKELEK